MTKQTTRMLQSKQKKSNTRLLLLWGKSTKQAMNSDNLQEVYFKSSMQLHKNSNQNNLNNNLLGYPKLPK